MHAARVAPEKTDTSARPADVLQIAERVEARMTKMTYSEQLRHPKWQKRRLEIMQRDEFTCQLCYDQESPLHVHHKHYSKGKSAWEYDDDALVTVCEACHDVLHEQGERVKQVMAKLRVDGPCCIDEAIGLVAGWAAQGIGADFAQFAEASPFHYALGEFTLLLAEQFHYRKGTITELRDLLSSADGEKRQKAIDAMVVVLRGA